MNRSFLIIIMLAVSNIAYALNVSIIGPCDEKPLLEISYELIHSQSVLEASFKILNKNEIPYSGGDYSITSIYNTPVGDDLYEIINDREMMAYGWCYAVNGVGPEVLPSDYSINNQDTLVWWFGYAHYKDGKWITQCSASYLRKSPKFCN